MKNIYIILFMLFNSVAFSQVGINTPNPQGSFHVDAGKNNPVTGTPSTLEQADDLTVTSAGMVGMGTTTPGAHLEINNGTTAGAIKIIDGTEGTNKVLTSDASGLATWKDPTTQNVDVLLRAVASGTAQAISGSSVVVNFNTKEFDRDSSFDLTTDRFVAPTAGYYLVTCSFSSNASGTTQGRNVIITKNGTTYEVLASQRVVAGDGFSTSGSSIVFLDIADFVSLTTGVTAGTFSISRVTMNIIKVSN